MRALTRRDFLKALSLAGVAVSFPSGLGLGAEAPRIVESFDSGTRVIREVAEALTGKGRSILECYPPGAEVFLWFLSFLPEDLRIGGIEWGISLSVGHSPRKLKDFRLNTLYEWCLGQYPPRKYPAIIVGAPNGGVSHLASLLGAPFLTLSFGISFKHPTIKAEDIRSYHEFGRKLTDEILKRCKPIPIEVINHYDPLHDRALVKYVNRIRIKLLELPQIYQDFILKNLTKGGKLILINCRYPWLQYRVAPRSFLQVGGLGGVSPQKFLKLFAKDLELEQEEEERVESEWGCPVEFADSVKEFAQEQNIELIEIKYDHPEKYSLLAYQAYLRSQGVRASYIIIDCFNHQNPLTNILTGIPGLWLPFNTEDSFSFAQRFLSDKNFERIYFTVLPSFANSPDTVPLDRWIDLLSQRGKLKILGLDQRTFPTDTLAPFRFVARMKGLRKIYKLPRKLSLEASAIDDLLIRRT